jgi:hypothetical protein
MHAMCAPGHSRAQCQKAFLDYIEVSIKSCNRQGLAQAIHAYQDFYLRGHQYTTYHGLSHLPPSHVYYDLYPSPGDVSGIPIVTENIIKRFEDDCSCKK